MFTPANTAHFVLLIPSVRNDFKVLAFHVTEAISSLYAIQVELVSESTDFDLESLLSQSAFLQFGLSDEGLPGRIEDVFVGEAGKRLTRYHLILVPALHYLQFSHDQRIFQNLTVLQIIAQVFKDTASWPMRVPCMSAPALNANSALSTVNPTTSTSKGCVVRTGFRGTTSTARVATNWYSPTIRPISPSWGAPRISKAPAWRRITRWSAVCHALQHPNQYDQLTGL